MLELYLVGVIIAMYLAFRMFRHEQVYSLHTQVGMITGMSFFSWLAVILILVHFKLHYKWEIRRMYESALKQRALLM